MAGAMGASVSLDSSLPAHGLLFGEDQARYLIATPRKEADKVIAKAKAEGIKIAKIGNVGGDVLKIDDKINISCDILKEAHEGWLKNYMTRVRK